MATNGRLTIKPVYFFDSDGGWSGAGRMLDWALGADAQIVVCFKKFHG